jgi:hypothetical protein
MKFESSTPIDNNDNAGLHEPNGTSVNTLKNGIVKESTNGVSSPLLGNGALRNDSPLDDHFFGHSREEVTRLMIQTLNDLGYK